MLKYFAGIVISFFLASCAGEKTEAFSFPSVVDSFEVVYYKKPFTDSARYYRFFRVATTNDSTFVREMTQLFTGAYEKFPKVKKCLSEGKLILPLGGEAYRTIYFSRVETGCPYLYYIKDGAFYYFEISPVLNEKLNILEKQAVDPE